MKGGAAGAVLEGKGLAVSPGFIDVHDHSDVSLLANPNAESIVHQGITTVISGQCGGTPFPVPDLVVEERKEDYKKLYGVDLTWRDMAGFFSRLEEKRPAINYATLVGHGSVRGAVVGFNDRPPTADELDKMKRLVEDHIRGGAFGLSTGLEYQPGSFARPEEIAELCHVVARHQAVYATHMRNEGDGILESLDESIGAAQASGAKLQISHFKVAYRRNWPKLDAALGRLERAKRDGVDVFCDRYPYIAASTGLSYYFPPWTKEGTTEDFIRRLKDPSADARLRAYLKEQERRLGSWDKVVISSVASEKNRRIQGKNILEAAREAGQEPYVFIRDLLIEEDGMVDMIIFIMNEDNLEKILGHPLVGVGCDGSAAAPYGILSLGQPHPRNYGTFPRYLGKYVRVEKVLTLEEAIRKITSVPAVRFGLAKRGMIKEGYSADLVVFNPDRIEDKATWEAPHQYPAGIEYVIVNGQVVVDHNQHTGRRAGHILKKQA
jgi:N-acyl-D-amino-acid deacylase